MEAATGIHLPTITDIAPPPTMTGLPPPPIRANGGSGIFADPPPIPIPPIPAMPELPASDPPPTGRNIDRASESDEASGTDREDSEEDEGAPHPRWQAIQEDKSVPCDDELAFIASKDEHGALDNAYWEKETFSELNDPEIVPLEHGTIDWTVEAFNGTKEKPNKERLMRSPVVNISGLDWQIKFYPRGNRSEYLSVYLECVSMLSADYAELEDFKQPPFPFLSGCEKTRKRRSVAAQISIVMYNPTEPRVYESQTEAHQFHKKSADYGWKYFTRYPRYEFHLRQHGQRSPILQSDKLAFRAYIRVVHDSTGCMWEHANPSPDDMTAVTGLRPFTKSIQYLAAAIPLLHFKPFREFVKRLSPKSQMGSWLQPLLLKMYTRKRSSSYGSQNSISEGDVMELLFRISLCVQDEDSAGPQDSNLYTELVGAFHAERGTACGTSRLNTKDYSSIQAAVDNHPKVLAQPALLTLELQRQEHDKKDRRWKKVTNKVQIEDEIQVSGVKYTLFAFITHCGHLQSCRYNSYVRPQGIDNGWYAYQDGKVSRLTEKQARERHSGIDRHGSRPSTPEDGYDSPFSDFRASAEVTCAVMYVRHDKAQETFAAPREEDWDPPFLKREEPDLDEPPKTAVHETFPKGDRIYGDNGQAAESETSQARIASMTELIERSAVAATPDPPLLMDGEDIVMRDADADSSYSFELPESSGTGDGEALEIGTLDWLGRPYYQGQWKGGKYHGGGHLIMTNGNEYLGEFRDGQPHGYGKMIYSTTGDVYDGEWQEGEHHGRGKLVEHTTGNVFEGGWQHGRKHGEFVLTGSVTDEDRSCCTICYDRAIATAFYDCGHVVACRECASLIENCPVCRKRVVARLQLYGVKMTLA